MDHRSQVLRDLRDQVEYLWKHSPGGPLGCRIRILVGDATIDDFREQPLTELLRYFSAYPEIENLLAYGPIDVPTKILNRGSTKFHFGILGRDDAEADLRDSLIPIFEKLARIAVQPEGFEPHPAAQEAYWVRWIEYLFRLNNEQSRILTSSTSLRVLSGKHQGLFDRDADLVDNIRRFNELVEPTDFSAKLKDSTQAIEAIELTALRASMGNPTDQKGQAAVGAKWCEYLLSGQPVTVPAPVVNPVPSMGDPGNPDDLARWWNGEIAIPENAYMWWLNDDIRTATIAAIDFLLDEAPAKESPLEANAIVAEALPSVTLQVNQAADYPWSGGNYNPSNSIRTSGHALHDVYPEVRRGKLKTQLTCLLNLGFIVGWMQSSSRILYITPSPSCTPEKRQSLAGQAKKLT